jgi:D-alanine--poly(phosphoribitol) ligase subunit 1
MKTHYFNLANYFYDVVLENADEKALIYSNGIVSYQELNALSNQLARYFLSLGVLKRDVIGIFNTKSPLGYAAMLAALKIGAIYTNIDEKNPISRLEKILQTCQPKILVSDIYCDVSHLAKKLNIPFIDLSTDHHFSKQNTENLEISKTIVGNSPAYIMFTSGSTGIPKGVVISHENVLSFLGWSIRHHSITKKDRFAQVSPLYFDNSVFDFYTALFSGASLVPIDRETLKNPLKLVKLVDELCCTIWFSVPSLLVYLLTMRVLNKQTLQSIRIFTFGGEGFPKNELKKLHDLYSSNAKLVNVYGPTEGTCICSSYEISKKDFEDMSILAPLGRMNPNFDYLIVDNDLDVVLKGEKGELCLTGSNIGLGYYNDLEKTNNSFIQNPLVRTHRDIIYKTGDIVYESNDLLWFAGRQDNQIKHMGYRIELEEIESALNGLDYISQSAVLYHRVHENYGKIIAFLTCANNVTKEKIITDLVQILPEYMLPNIIEICGELPKNSNGKVDKVRLKNDFNF